MGRGGEGALIRLWGEVGVEPAGGSLSLRARALIAWLALGPPEGASRARLAALLWEERDDAQALANLRQLLHDHRWLAQGETPLLIVSRDRLALGPFDTDHARLLAAQPVELAAALDRTYSQPLGGLDGMGPQLEAWLAAERRRASEHLGMAVREAMQALIDAQDFACAQHLAEAWARFDPCDEALARQGFIADGELHDTASLERRMARLREHLAADFDADPAEATVTAYLAAARSMGLRPAEQKVPSLPAGEARRLPRRRWALAGIAALSISGLAVTFWRPHPANPPAVAAEQRHRASQLVAAARRLNAGRNPVNFNEAADLARAAIVRDPGSAPALAELALAISGPAWVAERQHPGSGDRLRREALGYVDRALEIDPSLPRALAIKGLIVGGDAGAQMVERAAAAEPADADIWRWTALSRESRGDFAGALAARGEAVAADPTSVPLTGAYVGAALQLGRRDLAEAAIARFARVAGPAAASQFEGNFAMLSGQLGRAAAMLAQSVRTGSLEAERGGLILMNLAHAVGDDAGVRALAARLPTVGPGYAPVYDKAGAPTRARAAGPHLFDTLLVEVELRSLIRAGDYRLVLAAADPGPGSSRQGWSASDDDDPVAVGATVALALAQAGRMSDAEALRRDLALRVAAAGRQGRSNHAQQLARMRLACLDGDAGRAAAALSDAIAAGWRGQFVISEPDPADDPVCANVAGDPRWTVERKRLAGLIAAERPAVERAVRDTIAWLDANPLPSPRTAQR